MVWQVFRTIRRDQLIAVQYRITQSQRIMQTLQLCLDMKSHAEHMRFRSENRVYAFMHDAPTTPTRQPITDRKLVIANTITLNLLDALREGLQVMDNGYDVSKPIKIDHRSIMWMSEPADGIFENPLSYRRYREYSMFEHNCYADYRYPDVYRQLHQMMEGYEHADNPRIANADDEVDRRIYQTLQARGCCGSVDTSIKFKGRKYLVGFNYGH